MRKPRVIKQNDPLNDRDYVRDHQRSLIALLVPEHIDYTLQVLDRVTLQRISPENENLSCKPQLVVVSK